jgi:hypothetical protein
MIGATSDELVAHFTGRGAELAAYDELWAESGRQRVLTFSGFSGNGKSWLLLYLVERERGRNRPVVLLDLADPALSQAHIFLDRLADELQAQIPRLDLRRFRRAMETAEREATAIRSAPAGMHVDVDVTADHGASVSGSPVSITAGAVDRTAAANQMLADHWRQARRELLRCLREAMRGRAWSLLVDSYEIVAHAADTDFRDWFAGELLSDAMRPGADARVVVAGRERLPAGRWREIELAEWDRTHSTEYLRSWGVADGALLDAMFDHCRGHPLTTDLARAAWAAGEESGRPLRPSDLRSFAVGSRLLAVEWLMDQFVGRVPARLAEAVLYAAHLRHLTLEGLMAILPEGRQVDEPTYTRLQQLSFVRPAPEAVDGVLRAHDLIREVEQGSQLLRIL